MRWVEILVLIILLLVIMAGMSVPLWWDYAAPYIFGFPAYLSGVINDIKNFIDMILKSF